jgi:hypothetical protein
MPGLQLENRSLGAGYQSFAETVVGRIAALAPVPDPHDFGVDFYALPRKPLPGKAETAIELCGVQVKGGDQDEVTYGGRRPNHEWKHYQVEWLRDLDVPLYIAAVDRDFTEVRLYSTTPVIGVFIRAGLPLQITCTLGAPAFDEDASISEPHYEQVDAVPGSDGRRWTCDLGAPFLLLRLPDLRDEATRTRLFDVFVAWIRSDRVAQMYLHQHVPWHMLPLKYRTNQFPTAFQEWLFWNVTPGATVGGLERHLAPPIAALVQHLIGQQDAAALGLWVPVLKWLDSHGNLTPMGQAAIREVANKGLVAP